jgi:single-strand DNA-binding protein
MGSLNKALLIGRLGKDPEIRYFQDGTAVANFSIATSEKWKDKSTGENREKTEWHRIVAFRRLGEICGEYLTRGKEVYIEGRIQTRSWEKDGITRYTTEIVADKMQMLGSKDSGGYGGGSQGGGSQGGDFQGSSGQGQGGGGSQGSSRPDQGGGYSDNGFSGGPPPQPPDDDIPF